MKIAFIVEFPTQFEVPFYQYINNWIKGQRAKSKDVNAVDWDFHVIFNNTDQQDYHDFELGKKVGWGFNLYEGYPYFIADKNNKVGSVDEILSREQYDFVILNGYKNSYKGLPELCKSKDIPIALRIDSVLYNLTPFQKILKRIYLPFAYRKFNHFFAVGSETRKFLNWLGINNENIQYFSYATHDEWFKEKAADQSKIQHLKVKLGLKEEKVILSVAKFIERESPWDILNAFKLLNDPNTALILVGDGKDRQELEVFAAKNKHLKIIFTGYVPFLALPYYYGLTDIFIHAAKNEPWGVSVQEAIASGCTVITSDKVGSSTDLIHHGLNGFIYQYNNIAQLKGVITQSFKIDPIKKEKINLEILEHWGYSGIWGQIKSGALMVPKK
jgi:glycosyltransferase involved in cell wall biosynthesis